MLTHRAEHAQCEIGSPSQKIEKIVLWHKQNSCGLCRARICRVTPFGCKRRFGKRFDRLKQMDHLLFPRRIDPMHVYGALLYDIKSLAAIALAKKVFPLVEVL